MYDKNLRNLFISAVTVRERCFFSHLVVSVRHQYTNHRFYQFLMWNCKLLYTTHTMTSGFTQRFYFWHLKLVVIELIVYNCHIYAAIRGNEQKNTNRIVFLETSQIIGVDDDVRLTLFLEFLYYVLILSQMKTNFRYKRHTQIIK